MTGSKLTMREHYTRASQFDSSALAALEAPPLDITVHHIWAWWLDLNSARQHNGMGLNPLSWLEIDVYNRLFDLHMMPEEVELLRQVEAEYQLTMRPAAASST